MAVLLLSAQRLASASDPLAAPQPEILSVLAVERAPGLFGRFRVVFDVATPLPPAADARPQPQFFLGRELLRIPPGNDARTRIVAYTDSVPPKPTTLRAVWSAPGGARQEWVASEQPCDAAGMLRRGRPGSGEYEAACVQRAAGPMDLLDAWSRADVVARDVRALRHCAGRH